MRRSRHCGDLWKPAKFWTLSPPSPPYGGAIHRMSTTRRRTVGNRNRWAGCGRLRHIHNVDSPAAGMESTADSTWKHHPGRSTTVSRSRPPARRPAIDVVAAYGTRGDGDRSVRAFTPPPPPPVAAGKGRAECDVREKNAPRYRRRFVIGFVVCSTPSSTPRTQTTPPYARRRRNSTRPDVSVPRDAHIESRRRRQSARVCLHGGEKRWRTTMGRTPNGTPRTRRPIIGTYARANTGTDVSGFVRCDRRNPCNPRS